MYDKFLFFMTPMCPNCGEIHEWLDENSSYMEKGEEVDATTTDGLEKAKEYSVTGVPTIVFLKDGKKVATARDLEEFQTILDNKSLADF